MNEAVETPEVTPETPAPAPEEVTPEQPTEETPAPEAATEGESEESPEEAQPEPKKPSPRYEKRIRQLSAKLAEANTNSQPAPVVIPTAPAVPFGGYQQAPQFQSAPQLQLPPGEYTQDQVLAWAQQQAARNNQAFTSIEVQQLRAEMAQKEQQAKVENAYHNDLRAIESKYSELNEDSPKYDPQLAHEVTEAYEDALLADPKSASLQKTADRFMRLQRRTAAASGAKAAENVAKQRQDGAPVSSQGTPKASNGKWTAEKVAALSIDEYAANEAEIKRDLSGL